MRCESNATCTPGSCVPPLRNQTVVLFTSDQGRPSSSFGNPVYRGGKATTWEGGVRAGLLAWGPGTDANIGNGEGMTPSARRRDDTFLGSQVDILPTVLDLAKCAPTVQDADDQYSQYSVKACSEGPATLCTSTCSFTGAICETRLLAGKSLLPALRGQGEKVRDFAFAAYPNKPSVIMSRRGHDYNGPSNSAPDAQNVCIYSSAQDGQAATTTRADRVRVGGSCDVGCTQNTDCTNPSTGVSSICTLGGTYCVEDDPPGTKDKCKAGTDAEGDPNPGLGECKPISFARCGKGSPCAANADCIQIETVCNTCTTAAWKLFGSDTPLFFDLAGNPEEIDELNCRDEAVDEANPDHTALSTAMGDLSGRLATWVDCVGNEDSDVNCNP